MNSEAPIGVFDSGFGGISVLLELELALSHEDFIYFADSAWCPYGGRSLQVVTDRARAVTEALMARGVKLVTVACNTATVAAIDELRRSYDVEFVGMEPAVKPAAAMTRTGVVGVLSTRMTAEGERMHSLVERHAHGVKVLTQACPGLVECVEAGELDRVATRRLVEVYTRPLLAAGADTLVLGCTHYAFLRPLIAATVGPEIGLVDTAAAVARRVADRLQARDLLASRTRSGSVQWLTSGSPARMAAVGSHLWGHEVLATVPAA